ncbi:MAG: hypothetical protein Q8911_12245 [Bacillota bacterium]|nr:hypothetical protein [Bacillota bacterium]
MPDDNTENVGNLTLIKKVEKRCKEQPNWIEMQSPKIEELIFGSKNYLEDNSFSTSHQLVNVYRSLKRDIKSEVTITPLTCKFMSNSVGMFP